jgi:hypothetical protein
LPSFARPCIEIAGSQSQISADVARGDLPLAGQWLDPNGGSVVRYELPGGCCQVPDSDEEQIVLRIPVDTERVAIKLRLTSHLPSYSAFARAADDEAVNRTGGTRWPLSTLGFAHAVNRSLSQYVEFVSRLHDHPEPFAGDWDGRERHDAVCSIVGLAERWGKITALDAPPSALIVRIARRLPPVLETICAKPRRVLRRERVLTPIAQIQELDVASLRWISRQPGRTLAEKAGHKQQLQSVRRFENADILENRVVREFLILCILAARRYEAENERFLRDDGENGEACTAIPPTLPTTASRVAHRCRETTRRRATAQLRVATRTLVPCGLEPLPTPAAAATPGGALVAMAAPDVERDLLSRRHRRAPGTVPEFPCAED